MVVCGDGRDGVNWVKAGTHLCLAWLPVQGPGVCHCCGCCWAWLRGRGRRGGDAAGRGPEAHAAVPRRPVHLGSSFMEMIWKQDQNFNRSNSESKVEIIQPQPINDS